MKLWDVATGRERFTLRMHDGQILSVAFSPDGRTLAAGCWGSVLKLWDLTTRLEVATLRGHSRAVWYLSFSPDGKTLASASEDGTVKMWDIATRREVGTQRGHRLAVISLAFSPDGKRLATGSGDSTVKLWDLATKREVATYKGHASTVLSVAFSPDGKTLASVSNDKTVRLWDATNRGDAAPILAQKASVNALAFSRDGKTLALGSGDGTAQLWDVASRRTLTTLRGHQGAVWRVVFSPDAPLLATGGLDRKVKLWDLPSRRVLATLPGYISFDRTFEGSAVFDHSIAISPDGKTLAVGRGMTQKKAVLWDIAAGREVASLPHSYWVTALAFSPDGRTLATSTWNELKLWEVASRREIGAFEGSTDGTQTMSFSPDGRTIATGGWLGTVRLWDVAKRRTIATLTRRAGWVNDLAFSPDGKTLAVTNANTVMLWNLTIGQVAATLKGHKGEVNAVAFSPDGNSLASASSDGTVRLWRAASSYVADSPRVAIGGSDRAVTLEWRPLPGVAGYHVYRGPVGATRARFVKLTPQPLAGTSYTDHGPALVNGRRQTYAVAAVYRKATGRAVEGLRVIVEGAPMAAPAGFLGHSINEGLRTGSAAFDSGSGGITLRGCGWNIWGSADHCYFVSQQVAGDFQVTVTLLTQSTAPDPPSRAGLMIRESLEAGGPTVALLSALSGGLGGLYFQHRITSDDETDRQRVLLSSALKLPITLRLTRQGDTITGAITRFAGTRRDGGRSFQPDDKSVRFEGGLAKTLLVGLAIASGDPTRIGEARFSGLELRKR